jgi:hypothetical protein
MQCHCCRQLTNVLHEFGQCSQCYDHFLLRNQWRPPAMILDGLYFVSIVPDVIQPSGTINLQSLELYNNGAISADEHRL